MPVDLNENEKCQREVNEPRKSTRMKSTSPTRNLDDCQRDVNERKCQRDVNAQRANGPRMSTRCQQKCQRVAPCRVDAVDFW